MSIERSRIYPSVDNYEDPYPMPRYPNGWYGICREADVRPRKVTTVSALGKEWLLFRDEHGTVSLVEAFCPHMGAHMGGGKVVGGRIECPFHGWQFNGKGGVRVCALCSTDPSVAGDIA